MPSNTQLEVNMLKLKLPRYTMLIASIDVSQDLTHKWLSNITRRILVHYKHPLISRKHTIYHYDYQLEVFGPQLSKTHNRKPSFDNQDDLFIYFLDMSDNQLVAMDGCNGRTY